MNLHKTVKDYFLYETREESITAENYYGLDTKRRCEVWVKVFNNKKIPDPSFMRSHLMHEISMLTRFTATTNK